MIKVENIDKIYGRFKAVDNVSFHIGKGEIVGLLGPNGAGKTTIMKILTGYHYPTHGTAILNGYSIYDDLLKVKESTGYLPEMAPLYDDLTVIEYLDFMADIRKIPKSRKKEEIDRVIQECGLSPVVRASAWADHNTAGGEDCHPGYGAGGAQEREEVLLCHRFPCPSFHFRGS